jgi:hypothetical protein
MRKGELRRRYVRRGSPDVSVPTLLVRRDAELFVARQRLICFMLPSSRRIVTAAVSVPALITVVVSIVIALSPTRPAHVNPHAARADVHALRKRWCRSCSS